MGPRRDRSRAEPDTHIGFLDEVDKPRKTRRRAPGDDDLDLDRIL